MSNNAQLKKLVKGYTAGSGAVMQEEKYVPFKEYLVLWKDRTADAEGFYREKTVIYCDENQITAVRHTLPVGEYEFICVTDEKERLRKEAEIEELERRIARLKGEPIDDLSGDEPMAEVGYSDGQEYPSNYRGRNNYVVVTTYFRKEGDPQDAIYEKEEVRRYSERSLKVTGIMAE